MTTPAALARRLGVLVPSSNTTLEREFAAALPQGISLHVGRLPLTRIAAQSIVEILRPLEEESRKLASADVDLILLGATAPGFMKGLGYDREVSAHIEQASGKPVVSTTQASLWACLRRLGWTRPLPGAGRLLDEHLAAAA